MVVKTPLGKFLKLYAWVRKEGEWKVDLANLNIGYWDFQKFAEIAEKLREKYKVNRNFGIEEE